MAPPVSLAPLTLAELGARLDAIGGFEARPLIAVAVSGGPDSMALTLLADRWARERGGQVWGLTVDHGLRRESADEARAVAGWLAAHAISHQILSWIGPKPATGIQAAAREARYRLLADWCRAHGCLHLLTAHHREDQIETHLIRRRAHSGVDGLAGMSAIRELPGCRLVRPLLAVPRGRLAALLDAECQPFLRDPSNLDPTFERARLRLIADGIADDDTVAEIAAYGRQRVAREQALAAILARSVSLHPAGVGVLDRAALATAEPEMAERMLSAVAECLGGARYPARRERLARLRAALVAEPGRARTLGGCRFVPWRGVVLVLRELAAASPPVALEPGTEGWWDRRFAVSLPAGAARGLRLGYLGQSGTKRPAGLVARDPPLPRLAHSVLPALWDTRGVAAVPHLGYRRSGTEVLPCLSFLPARPLTPAGFTVV